MRPCTVAFCAALLLTAHPAAADSPTPAEWNAKLATGRAATVKEINGLARWCDEESFCWTAHRLRHLALRADPDHAGLRADFGYDKTEDGWTWNELRRDGFRTLADEEDPEASKPLQRKLAAVRRNATRRFTSLATSAAVGATQSPEAAEEWKARARVTWELVLLFKPQDERAHTALGSTQVAGRYVLPRWRSAAETRERRRAEAREAAERAFKVEPVEQDDVLARAGLEHGAARSGAYLAGSTHGADVAAAIVLWARRALRYTKDAYRLPGKRDAPGWRREFHYTRTEDELSAVLVDAYGWTPGRTEKHLEGASGAYPNVAAFVNYDSDSSGDVSVDRTVQVVARSCIYSLRARPEPWLTEAVAMDVVVSLRGRALTAFSQSSRYGGGPRETPGAERWLAAARGQAEVDDGLPLARLRTLPLHRMSRPIVAKVFAFLRYLLESDEERGRAFLVEVARSGSVAAARTVYDTTLEELDRRLRTWLLEAH